MSDAVPTPAPRPREVIPCTKCGAENLAGATRCHECHAHLYLGCPACGAGNLRSRKNCALCGARLGRSWLSRLKVRIFRRFKPMEAMVGLLVLAGVIFLLVRFLVSFGADPEPKGTPASPYTLPSTDPLKQQPPPAGPTAKPQ